MEAVPRQKDLKAGVFSFLMAKLGQTYGRVKQNAFANRIYFKPALRHAVIRHPGVIRRSEKVLAINAKLEGVKGTPDAPATKCKGKPWDAFVDCLRTEMKRLVGKVA